MPQDPMQKSPEEMYESDKQVIIADLEYKGINTNALPNLEIEHIDRETEYYLVEVDRLNIKTSDTDEENFTLAGAVSTRYSGDEDIVNLLRPIDNFHGTVYEQAYFDGTCNFRVTKMRTDEDNRLYKISSQRDGRQIHSVYGGTQDGRTYYNLFSIVSGQGEDAKVIEYIN